MAKKKTQTVDITESTPQELDPNRMYSIEDKNEILRLFKVANASQSDMDSIYRLLKKYVNPNARMYITGCNCGSSITSYWRQIVDFWTQNGSKFES